MRRRWRASAQRAAHSSGGWIRAPTTPKANIARITSDTKMRMSKPLRMQHVEGEEGQQPDQRQRSREGDPAPRHPEARSRGGRS